MENQLRRRRSHGTRAFTCIQWKCEQSHALADLLQLVGFEWREILAGVLHSVHASVAPDQLDELLHAELELDRGIDLPQLGFVVVAPADALGCVALPEILLDVARRLEDVQVGQFAYVLAVGEALGRLVVAQTEEMLDDHAIQARLFPLARVHGVEVFGDRFEHGLADVVQAPLARLHRRELVGYALVGLPLQHLEALDHAPQQPRYLSSRLRAQSALQFVCNILYLTQFAIQGLLGDPKLFIQHLVWHLQPNAQRSADVREKERTKISVMICLFCSKQKNTNCSLSR